MASKATYYLDPNDGLRVECIGPWAKEKHARLRKYVDISRAARRKFNQEGRRSGSTYIDLYCGPGRAEIRGSGEVVDGSPVLAWRESVRGGIPFTEVHIGDKDEANVAACETRLRELGCERIYTYVGDAATTVGQVAQRLNHWALHLAFLDPYSLLALPFSILKSLATFKRMDLIVHVSLMDLQRNMRQYAKGSRLESFCPGWQEEVDLAQKDSISRLRLFEAWKRQLEAIDGHKVAGVERVAGDNGVGYYWLVSAFKNELGEKFWKEIREVEPQRELPL